MYIYTYIYIYVYIYVYMYVYMHESRTNKYIICKYMLRVLLQRDMLDMNETFYISKSHITHESCHI